LYIRGVAIARRSVRYYFGAGVRQMSLAGFASDAMTLRGAIALGPWWFGLRPSRGATANDTVGQSQIEVCVFHRWNRVETFDP